MGTRGGPGLRLLSAERALDILAGVVGCGRPADASEAVLSALAESLDAVAAALWWRTDPSKPWRRWSAWAGPALDLAHFVRGLPAEAPAGALAHGDVPAVQEVAAGTLAAGGVSPAQRCAAEAGATHRLVVPLPAGPQSGAAGGVAELFFAGPPTLGAAEMGLVGQVGRQAGATIARLADLADAHATNLLLTAQMEGTPDGTVVVSPDRRVIAHNHRILSMFGVSEEQLRIDAPTEVSLRQVRDAIAHDPSMIPLLEWAHEHTHETVRRTVELGDGRVLDMHGAPVFDRDGHYHGRAWYARDITDRTRAERQLRAVADTLQRALRPPHLPTVPGLEIAGRYRAGAESMEVGGDFYDVFAIGDRRWAVVLGDVCGQGAAAATVTALARHTVRAVAAHAGPPSATLAALNTALVEQDPEVPFVTAVCLTLTLPDNDPAAPVGIELARAGHPSPLLVRADGEVVGWETPGSLLGVLDRPTLTDTALTLAQHESLVLVTDGVLEARDEDGNEFGEARLRRVIAGRAGRPAEEVARAIETEVLDFRRGDRSDDFAILVLTVPGREP